MAEGSRRGALARVGGRAKDRRHDRPVPTAPLIVPDYSGLTAEVDDTEVSDDDVDEQIQALRERFGSLADVERPAADGDFVVIDLVATKDDTFYAGVVKSEDDQTLVLNTPDDGPVTLKKADIKSRERGLSGMPEGMENQLSARELRDLIEFLAIQKAKL